MINPIPDKIAKLWEKWNIRGVILFSLSLQIFLIVFSPLRKRFRNSLVVFFIWASYLLADWAANFCVGLIASNQVPSSKTIMSTESDLLAFWASFLLMHLGGPDTITAFALEDNELWLRRLLGFTVQVISCVYFFLLTLPENRLWIPTFLVFLAGIIKFGERTYALYLASKDTILESMKEKPNLISKLLMLMQKCIGKNEAKPANPSVTSLDDGVEIPEHAAQTQQGQLSDVEVVLKAYHFFDNFKGIIVEKIFSFGDLTKSREYFHSLSAEDGLRVMQVELNFFYEAFFTKFLVVRRMSGYLSRFVSNSCLLTALGLFFSMDKHKQGFDSFDVKVTYTLLYGAMALDALALLMLFFSDLTIVSFHHHRHHVFPILKWFLRFKGPKWSNCKKEPYAKFRELSTWVLRRRWSGSISGFNLISYCCPKKKKKTTPTTQVNMFQKFQSVVLNHYKFSWFVMWLHEAKNPFLEELWNFIFLELKRKVFIVGIGDDELTQISNSRGEWVIRELYQAPLLTWKGVMDRDEANLFIAKLLSYVNADLVAFDEILILWHIATHLCYAEAAGGDGHDQVNEQEFSKLLSDYMLYILAVQRNIISTMPGIEQNGIQDTLEKATLFFNGIVDKDVVEACKKLPLSTNNEFYEGKSLLLDACKLANELGRLQQGIKWKIICQVWVELLSYAACNCRISIHVQLLSKGGELISLVWLLMMHLGLSKQFKGPPTILEC